MQHKRAYLRYMNCLLHEKLLKLNLKPQRDVTLFETNPEGPCIRVLDQNTGAVVEGENFSMSLRHLETYINKLQ
jgi:hypothetical protein